MGLGAVTSLFILRHFISYDYVYDLALNFFLLECILDKDYDNTKDKR